MIDDFKASHSDEVFGTDYEALVADGRYKFINKHFSVVVKRKNNDRTKMTKSDKVDKVLTHKIWGIPIFLVILFLIFHLTFSENLFFLNGFNESQNWMPSLSENEAFLVHDANGNLLNEDGEIVEDAGDAAYTYGARWLATIYDGTLNSPGVVINNIWNDMIVGDLFGLVKTESTLPEWQTGRRVLSTTVSSKVLRRCSASCLRYWYCSCSSVSLRTAATWRVLRSFLTVCSVNSVLAVVHSCL